MPIESSSVGWSERREPQQQTTTQEIYLNEIRFNIEFHEIHSKYRFRKIMLQSFNDWWNRPIKVKDRIWAALIGAVGGFWIGILSRLFLGPMPVPLIELGYWALGSVIIGIIMGIIFPKPISILLYPFTMLGIGSN